MLLLGYRLKIFRSKSHAGAQTLHCFAHLNNDVSAALSYLNGAWRFFLHRCPSFADPEKFRENDYPPSLKKLR